MDLREFSTLRLRLGKTQRELSRLLGVSLTAVHSYEQGWRNIPVHVERHLLFLVAKKRNGGVQTEKCWDLINCPAERRNRCPAWEFDAGDVCWFINGTVCHGKVQSDWRRKMELCRRCSVLGRILQAPQLTGDGH